ncbi:MAG TPA: GAF domain-containing SpoIIE family protein phosphatase [Solirubrobacteraceae bacterium]|nr:GAF domain-containing SpoIIE family protein phosphatase [Solirubrobacteraceae bacterium]
MSLLIEAGMVMASSLDLGTTMGQVARLTVPRLADLCVIDLLDEDDSIRDVAVACSDEALARELEQLRATYPLDPHGGHPVAQVIRSGEAVLLPEMSSSLLSSFAQGSKHAEFMIEHGYRSAVVAPLQARERTLGALSVLRLGDGRVYGKDDEALVLELARRAALAIDNARLFSELHRVQIAESFMAEASRVLASSMDYEETLKRVTRLVVPQIADWCAIDLLDGGREIERVATHHVDPARLQLAERLDREYRPTLDEPLGVPEVIRTGEARIFTEIPPEALAEYSRDSEHLALLSAVGANAVIIVPMIGAAGTIGAITLVSSESTHKLSQADLALAERLARRAGTAVENARLYTERSRIAHTLQQALLPESLPQVPGAEIVARYCAAGELNEVGGDFYDVLEQGAERWMLMIGDVCGKGPRAAGVTALARHTLRAAAMSGQMPPQMLGTLHRALRRQPPGADLCTVCLVTMERTSKGARLKIALAGHPPPLLIDPEGRARPIGRPGTLLGVLDSIEFAETDAELQPGETLLLYTDGVVEAGRPNAQLGEEGLIELCRAAPTLGLGELLERIEHAALDRAEESLRDDLALLGLRLSQGEPSRR